MLWHHEVEPAFRRLFDEHWRLSRGGSRGRDDPDRKPGRDWLDDAFEDAAEAACCPVAWLMPELMDLIARTVDQPIDRVRVEVRTLLHEQDFHNASGSGNDPRHRELVELYVDRLTRTIDRVRRHAPKLRAAASASDPSCFFG